jgi:hypothetical protein
LTAVYHGVEGEVNGGSYGRVGTSMQAGGQVGNLSGKALRHELTAVNGIGVFAPQYGPRRGFFLGVSKKI